VAANRYAQREGLLGARYPGGIYRLGLAIAVLGGLYLGRRLLPQSRVLKGLREILPFLACILIYTNLHDTIGFVNPHDIHDRLAAADLWLFGVQPTVWAEAFITPANTELMSFFYTCFFWIAPVVPLSLLARRRFADFRTATLGIVLCFLMGYVIYVIFPAGPPRLVLAHEYTKTLAGYNAAFTRFSNSAIDLLPHDSRAAFPSLHGAISLLAMAYAWRFARRLFWFMIPFVLGLWVSTVYLRHHFVVDLFAGWALAPFAYVLAPRLDRYWSARQRERGIEPARVARLARISNAAMKSGRQSG
jgi:membrane-associated phospholipid phosphatase